ncbi:MAG: hypothetical protein FJY55_13240 [Betaproteobacteria bacterium]|nr:hypothetical protein [Betaproteobacteria bacterium]
MKPGVYMISAADYHADPCEAPSLSSHVANILLRQSPLHAWWAHPRLNRNHQSQESGTFDYGKAAHAMLLENDRAALVVVDADDWRSKAAREARDAAREAGKYPVLARQLAKVEAMVLEAKEAGRDFFAVGQAEQTLVWREGDIWCRARPDWISNGHRMLDYKTTTNAEPGYLCERVLVQMGYDVQAAFYARGYEAVHRGEIADLVFLFQETEPPFACSLVSMSAAMWGIAQKKVERAIAIWTKCMSENRWPAYNQHIHYAEPTPWQLAQAETADAISKDADE